MRFFGLGSKKRGGFDHAGSFLVEKIENDDSNATSKKAGVTAPWAQRTINKCCSPLFVREQSPQQNKAVYTAASVACGWAGAVW